MSETTDPIIPAPEAPQPLPDAAVTSPAPDAAPAPEAAPQSAESAAEPTPEPKPKPQDRRFANMTAKLAAEATRAERAEAELAAARAMLEARNDNNGDAPRPAPQQDVEAIAARLVTEREFNRRLGEIDAAGKTDIGADAWESAKATLTSLGATKNADFLSALAETEHPAQIFAALADDTDTLLELLDKPPAAMATRLGRMDAKLAQPKAPVVSRAPAPAPKVGGTQIVAEPSIHDPNLSMKEWAAQWDKYAKANNLPAYLGGTRR